MTLINVNCTDQALSITSSPGVASGGVNEDRVTFTFCDLWTDYIKTAVFYRTADKVYHVLLDEEGTCVIPKEVLANPGVLHIGVFGVKGESVRTSNVLSYLVAQGAITEATAVPDPTPDIYAQLLATMGDLNKLATADKSSLVAAVNEVYRTGGGVPVVYTSGDGKLYEAEIEGVKSYSDIPMIILVPHVTSATVTPSLLIKGMTTAVPIRRNNTYQTGNNYTESGATATWLTADTPVLLLWNGRSWVALSQSQTYGGDIDGTIPVRSGGTGRGTLTDGSYLVGDGTNAVALKTAEEVRKDIGAVKTINGAEPDETGNVEVETSSVQVDASLTQEGKAADAKEVGDRLNSLSGKIDNIQITGGGFSSTLRAAMYNLLMDAAYQSSDHAADKAALEELLTGNAGGGDIVYYTITKDLTNVSIDNGASSIAAGSAYNATLTAEDGYTLDSVYVTMGGEPVEVLDGVISIEAVTGDIAITASAVKATDGIVFLDYVTLSGGAYFDTGLAANCKNKYLIGAMMPTWEVESGQYIWGVRARNNTSLTATTYMDDVLEIYKDFTGASRNTNGAGHGFGLYKSENMQGINGIDNLSNLVPWYLYTKWDAYCLEAYEKEDMSKPLGADSFIKGSMTSNCFIYALNANASGVEQTYVTPEKDAPANVYLGKVNRTLGTISQVDYPAPVDGIKYYVYKVWDENDNLLLHLRPAKMGGKVGMYDVVSSTFIESSEGTVTEGNEVAA